MVNPGAFRGSRKEFLLGKKAEYSAAVIGNYVADAVARIQRQYLKRYPIDFPHDQEPDKAFLQAVDDDAPDAEAEEPNAETMSESEFKAAVEKSKARKTNLTYRKKQIARWLSYQYHKDNNIHSKQTGAYLPYTTLIKKLTGKDIVRPRLKTPTNLWRKDQRAIIDEHLKGEIELQRLSGTTIPTTQYAAIRDRIARELFSELDEGVKRLWREKALAEHSTAMKKYKEEVHLNPSMAPPDLQTAIQGLIPFMQPILDMLVAVTGWKVTLLAGGPEPAQGGRLGVISMHSGYTSGDVKMTYGRAERARYKKYVIPSFGSFLKLCYSTDDCLARALQEDDGMMPMLSYEDDTDELTFHTIDSDTPSSSNVQASKGDNESQSQAAINPPTSSSATLSEDCNDGTTPDSTASDTNTTTQDSLGVDTTPFPFEEDHSDDEDIVASPLLSTPPSPVCSRSASPVPTILPSQQSKRDTALTDHVTTPIVIDLSTNVTSITTQVPTPTIPPVLLAPTVAVEPLSTLNGASEGTDVADKVGLQDSRKRKSTAGTTPSAVEEPVSKRARTKTMRAISSEEQNIAKKKRVSVKKAMGGKENKCIASSGKGRRG